MMNPPALVVYASYLEQANKFFGWGKSLGQYEIAAYNLSTEAGNQVILTDLLTPQEGSILRTRSGCLEPRNLTETLKMVNQQVEIISTREHCLLTEKFFKRLGTTVDGHAHNHHSEGRIIPSADDVRNYISFLHKTNRQHRYLVEVIYGGSSLNVFCFPKHYLNDLGENEMLTDYFIQNWLEQNYNSIHVENFEIAQDQ
jgi:hypothetical protein